MSIIKLSLRIFFLVLFFVLVLSNNSLITQYYAQSLSGKVIGEGTLAIQSGGTRESFNRGYVIKFPKWIISPAKANSIVFLRSNKINLRNFLEKKVRFEGSYYKIPFKKYSNISFSNPYDEVILDTIYVIK